MDFRRAMLRSAAALVMAWLVLVPRPAPGTVAEQRARLPPPAECKKDDVIGVWKSHAYDSSYHDWTEFTLVIRRAEGEEQLVGKIYNHSWDGSPKDEQPGPCQGAQRYRVTMEAQGSYAKNAQRISFRGTKWKLEEVVCGTLGSGWGYNLDHFSGKVDFELQEFQTVNNDGGRAVNHPTVFRRIKCLSDDEEEPLDPNVKIKPPAIFPDRHSGCDCDW